MANGFFNKIFSNPSNTATTTINSIDCLDFAGSKFAYTYTVAMYSKIMHECANRAMIPDAVQKNGYIITVHDSYSPAKEGMVSIVVAAMIECKRVYVKKEKVAGDVYIFHKVEHLNINQDEDLPADIIELDFRNFHEARVVVLLFDLLAGIMQTLSKNVTVSGGLVLKIHALSEMVANSQNMKPLLEQLEQINEGLTQGKSAYIDAQSSLEFPSFDAAPAEKSASFIYGMISSITGLPTSYIFGEVVGGLGDNSNSDQQRLNVAIRRYYFSIFSGVLYATYNHVFDYKQIVDDVNELITAFAFIESTQMLTPAGKLKFMINNTGMDEEDFTMSETSGQP